MSTYYHACPYCGCNIDPGEVCDCTRTTDDQAEKRKKTEETGGQSRDG